MRLWPKSLRARMVAVVLITTFIALAVAATALAVYDLAMELRKLPALANSLLVAVTGWGQERDRAQARAAGSIIT